MGCACHGGSKLAVTDILAFDQCLFCGMKHLTTAWSLWNEFSYQDLNLAAIDGQLRLAIGHLQYIEPELCRRIRDIALKIERRDLEGVSSKAFEDLLEELQESIYRENPDMRERISRLRG